MMSGDGKKEREAFILLLRHKGNHYHYNKFGIT